MKIPAQKNSQQDSTRDRVLEEACHVFAEKGYGQARISEICERAGANIAAVNYYFGDKERLYGCVWRRALERTQASYPIAFDGSDAGDPPAQRLRAVIHSMLGRVLDDGEAGCFSQLMVKEMAEPSAAMEDIVDEVVRPMKAHVEGIVRDLLGDAAVDPMRVQLTAFSIISQCVSLAYNRPVRIRLFGAQDFTAGDADAICDHILSFSLAGIQALAISTAVSQVQEN